MCDKVSSLGLGVNPGYGTGGASLRDNAVSPCYPPCHVTVAVVYPPCQVTVASVLFADLLVEIRLMASLVVTRSCYPPLSSHDREGFICRFAC